MNKKSKTLLFAISIFILVTLSLVTAECELAFAQQEENPDEGERIARIEGILEQMNERLIELNHLSDRIDNIHGSINTMLLTLFVTIIGSSIGSSILGAYLEKRWK